jgi:hypothetical protein
MEEEQ